MTPGAGRATASTESGEDRVRTVTVGRHALRIRSQGEGSPLLLINGLGAPLELWDPLFAHLKDRRLVAYDAPGCGGSSPGSPLTMWGHARLAAGLLDRLGLDRVDVLGFSFGGLVAQQLAWSEDGRVRRLVLASTTCGWGGVPGAPTALLEVASPLRYASPAAFRAAVPWYVGGRESTNEQFLAGQGRVRAAHPPALPDYLRQVLAAATWSSAPWLALLRQPALVISGSVDPLVPSVNARILTRLLPRARSRVVSGGGHLCLLDRAPELCPAIAAFLDEGDSARISRTAAASGSRVARPRDTVVRSLC